MSLIGESRTVGCADGYQQREESALVQAQHCKKCLTRGLAPRLRLENLVQSSVLIATNGLCVRERYVR